MSIPESLIKKVPLFKNLQPDGCRRVAAVLRSQVLKKGEALFRRGDEGAALFLIEFGRVKVTRQSALGDEVILAILSRGDFLGEMALLDGKPRSADVIALETTRVHILCRRDFIAFVMKNESAVKTVLAALSERLRKANDFLEDSLFLDVSARLAKKLVELAEQQQRQQQQNRGAAAEQPVELCLTQRELAATIGAKRESVNKAIKGWREEGYLQTTPSKIIIKDLEALSKKVMILGI
ncbi:MAG: Crp/Fnr family transcriptional regulator [Pseudomonadota bacterium]|nr:Crp/Fnr family transcriptional regulator [Pseudomonadota bacterium]